MSGYIGAAPVPQATQTRESFTATASQTTFNTAGYSPGYVDVFLNGVKLAPSDYTATNGSDIVLATGAASGDILETVAYEIFQVADQDFTGDFTVDGSTFVVDSTNNRVGIGTTLPSHKLEVSNAGALIANIENTSSTSDARIRTTNTQSYIEMGQDSTGGYIQQSGAYPLRTFVNGSERMRIDSSGNLLVGKTATGLSNQGAEFSSTGQVKGTAPNQVVGYFNRTSSDGSILEFRKDNTTVGSIGSVSGTDIELNSTLSGSLSAGGTKRFGWNTSGVFFPHTDNANNLGATASRFKDLYLSGGVYLGGTGSANHLDDYEEGTWTPTYRPTSGSFTSITYDAVTFGTYTKIGRMVTLVATLDLDALSFGSGSGNLLISGMPFSELDSVSSYSGPVSQQTGWSTAPTQVFFRDDGYLGLGYMSSSGAASYDVIDVSDMNSGNRNRMRFTLTYFTT